MCDAICKINLFLFGYWYDWSLHLLWVHAFKNTLQKQYLPLYRQNFFNNNSPLPQWAPVPPNPLWWCSPPVWCNVESKESETCQTDTEQSGGCPLVDPTSLTNDTHEHWKGNNKSNKQYVRGNKNTTFDWKMHPNLHTTNLKWYARLEWMLSKS